LDILGIYVVSLLVDGYGFFTRLTFVEELDEVLKTADTA
jgi:hypothetical protein